MSDLLTRRQFVRLVAGAPALLAACSAATAPAASSTSAPPPQQLTSIRVAEPGAIFEPLYTRAGRDAGIYAQYGLDVEFVDAPSDTIILSGVISGEFLAGRVGAQSVLTAIAQGSDIVMVAAPHVALPFVFAAQEGYDSLQSLYGQAVGGGGPGSFLVNVTDALYRARGLDPGQLVYVNTGTAAQSVAALAARKIAATLVLYTDLAVLKRAAVPTVQLADVREALPNYLRTVIVVRRKSLTDDDAVLHRFVVAHSKAYRWALAHREAVVQAAQKYQNRDRADAENNFDLLLQPKLVTPDFAFTPEQMDYMQQLNILVGSQHELMPFDKVADLRYVQAIAQELGPYVPPSS